MIDLSLIHIWEGDPVRKGDVLYTVSTDKLTNEIEAEEDGVLLKKMCIRDSNWFDGNRRIFPDDRVFFCSTS